MSSRESVSPAAEEGPSARATNGVRRAQQDADAAWAFYASGLVDGDDEDSEDEQETADFMRFQRARAHSRLRASSQRERQLQGTAPTRIASASGAP
ncbi:hypothetical protein Gpo141_00005948 [Globisporangium polare]